MLYRDYFKQMHTLESLKLERSGRSALLLTFGLVLLLIAIAWITPWVQTAQGRGTVSTVAADKRVQAVSALVSGQIAKWHVREGQRVESGEAIVTLIDQDPQLIARLEARRSALAQQQVALQLSEQAALKEFNRQNDLANKGLASVRDRDAAQIKLQEARTKLAALEAEYVQANTAIARQSTQTKYAPSSGVITRLLSGGEATSVKLGDVLAYFIPDDVERSVRVEISGFDAPLVRKGRKVRLQFEGWPVFQFSGWPSSAIGTFGGEVDFVEPVANVQGRFNVWIVPDPDDEAWPSADYVRLGSKARAWILLEKVRLGYEVWRQLNNFPPINNINEATSP